ncbi:hypothetical protein Tco_0854202, partial [Tanacetum coccineum]
NKASKDLDQLLRSQIIDKSKKGLGYSVVPLPHPLIYNRPKKHDLSYSGLDEFNEPKFKGYGTQDNKKESNDVCDKKSDESKENSDNSLVKEQVSKDTSSFVESSLNVDKEIVFPVDKKVESVKPKNHEKPVKKSVRSFNHVQAQCKNHQRERMAQAVNTARPKVVKTARPNSTVVNAVRVNQENAIKASACWVWRPTKPNSASITLKKHNYIDARGRSKHMTGNIAYLLDFKEFNGGYVKFGGGAHGGRISGKGLVKHLEYLMLNALPLKNWHVKRGWDTKIPQSSDPPIKVGDEAVHKELGDRMERAATTTSNLEAEQGSGSGPRCQDTILGDVDAQNRFETTSKESYDPPLSRGYTLGSGEDSLKLLELMKFATTKANIVNGERQLQDLIDKKKVIIMESSFRSDLHLEDAGGEDAESYLLIHSNNTLLINHLHLPNPKRNNHLRRLRDRRQRFLKMRQSMKKVYQHLPMIHNLVGRSIDADVDVSLVDETQERQDEDLMFDTGVLEDDEMHVEAKVNGKDEQSTKPDDSTAGEAVTTASVNDSVTTPSSSKDKGKGIMIEPEVPLKRKDQIALDEQIARDIQAKLDAELLEEQKLARKQEEEANIALIESWENTQAMMKADRLLAERLQSKEREELTNEEKAKLFMELVEKRI